MHKLVWNRRKFPIQQKREECFREPEFSAASVSSSTQIPQVCPLPGRKRRLPEFWPWWSGMMERNWAATAEICLGSCQPKFCPSNHQTSMWLIIWWGSCNHQASFSFLFWDCVVEPFPLAATGSFLRDGTKCRQPFLCVACSVLDTFLPKWSYFIWKEEVEVRRLVWVWRKGNAASFPGLLGLWPWLGCRSAGARLFPLGPAMEDECLGFCFFFLHHVASSQENIIDIFLLSSSSQSPSTYVATVQGTKCLYLIKSQNCLITVLNVRHLCNLNVRYKFNFWVSSIIFYKK